MRPFLLSLLILAAAPVGAAQSSSAPAQAADAGYYFLTARHLENSGRIDEAIAALTKAIALAPASAELHAELEGLYARQDRPVEAITAAEAAVKLDAGNREAN